LKSAKRNDGQVQVAAHPERVGVSLSPTIYQDEVTDVRSGGPADTVWLKSIEPSAAAHAVAAFTRF
jgi:hypothetical protein